MVFTKVWSCSDSFVVGRVAGTMVGTLDMPVATGQGVHASSFACSLVSAVEFDSSD